MASALHCCFMSIFNPSTSAPVSADREHALRATSRWKIAPSRREIFALCLATCVVFVTFLALFRNYAAAVDDFGDSSAYMTLASATRHWTLKAWWSSNSGGFPTRWRRPPPSRECRTAPPACDQCRRINRGGRACLDSLGRMDRRFLCGPEFRLAPAFVPRRIRTSVRCVALRIVPDGPQRTLASRRTACLSGDHCSSARGVCLAWDWDRTADPA